MLSDNFRQGSVIILTNFCISVNMRFACFSDIAHEVQSKIEIINLFSVFHVELS